MKGLFLLTILLCSALIVNAQNNVSAIPNRIPRCEFPAPTLRGLKLGMSPTDVSKELLMDIKPIPKLTGFIVEKPASIPKEEVEKSIIGSVTGKANERIYLRGEIDVGVKTFVFDRTKSVTVTNEKLEGIDKLTLDFYSDALFSIDIDYKREYKWQNVAEFIGVTSEKLGINKSLWDVKDNSMAHLFCDEFSMSSYLFAFGSELPSPSLTLDNSKISVELLTKAKKAYLDSIDKKAQDEEAKKKAFKP
jgi:hypothetical protein